MTDDTSHRVRVSSASPISPVIAAVPAKRPGCSVRRTPPGNRIAEVRLTNHDADYEASVAVVRNALGGEQAAAVADRASWVMKLIHDACSNRLERSVTEAERGADISLRRRRAGLAST